MNRWLIRNAALINEGRKYDADLRIVDGRIEPIDPMLDALPDEQVVDAAGLWLLPGMIDEQVHFREPGYPHKGDIASESAAAVAGGITGFMEMCHAPAQLFDVEERGFLREGYFADLVLVDPNAPFVVEREHLLYRCGWSPFEGRRFHSRIAATWLNGYRVWDGERLCGEPVGERLTYRRH